MTLEESILKSTTLNKKSKSLNVKSLNKKKQIIPTGANKKNALKSGKPNRFF